MATNTNVIKDAALRKSSSLIVCAKSFDCKTDYDYKILILKRSDRTALSSNHGVFPGGIYEPFDESIEWLKYFEEFGVTQQSLRDLVIIDSETNRPNILAPQGTGCYDRFFKWSQIWAREISLRINALRETFEEVGIFLCRTRNQLKLEGRESFCKLEFDKSKWQKLVHDDAKEFINMCKELDVVPDLWGLHEWCGWASPAVITKGYETAFFITFLNEVPTVLCEESEAKECLWLPPPSLLHLMRESEIFLLPPQFYELSRFIRFKSYDFLKNFSWERKRKGITMYRPIAYFCTDGAVFVLPGDDFYNDDNNKAIASRKIDCTKAELRARTKYLNRIENPGSPNAILYSNIKALNGHLMPLCEGNALHKL